MTAQLDLSLKDIKFLRAIRDINESPDRFASTEGGAVAATVTAITKATTLTKDEVNYRLNHRGLEDAGLIAVHKAELKENGSFGPKSAEITDEGVEELRAAQQRQGLVETDADGSVLEPAQGAGDDRVAELEARIEQLESTTSRAEPDAGVERRLDEIAQEVADLRETADRLESSVSTVAEGLEAIQADDYGALSEKREEQLRGAVKSMVAFYQIAESVLDIDVEAFEPAAGRADARRVKQTRRDIADALDVGGQGAGGLVQPEQVGGGAGASASSAATDLSTGGDWPDPRKSGGRVFTGRSDDESAADSETDAAGDDVDADAATDAASVDAEATTDEETGGAGVDAEPAADADATAAADAGDDEAESAAATEGGIYPPIGSNRDDADEPDTEDVGDTDDVESVDEETATADATASARTTADAGEPESAAETERGIYPPIGSNRDDTDEDEAEAGDADTASRTTEPDDDSSAGSTGVSAEASGDGTSTESAEASDDGIDRQPYARIVDEEPPVEIVDARAKADEREGVDASAEAGATAEAGASADEESESEAPTRPTETGGSDDSPREATAQIVGDDPSAADRSEAAAAAEADAPVDASEESADGPGGEPGDDQDDADDLNREDLLSAVANPDNSLASDD